MAKSENPKEGRIREEWIDWTISIIMLLLVARAEKLLVESWDFLNHLQDYIYAGTLCSFICWQKKPHTGAQALKRGNYENGPEVCFYFSGSSFLSLMLLNFFSGGSFLSLIFTCILNSVFTRILNSVFTLILNPGFNHISNQGFTHSTISQLQSQEH